MPPEEPPERAIAESLARLPARPRRVLLAVSGGADSMALLAAFARGARELSLEIAVGHVDHGWRGRGSREDARFVARQCRSAGVPFFLRKVAIDARGRSREEAAREARYAALAEMAREFRADAVATAHTRDDVAETLLLALLRGRPAEGLAGIREWRQDGFWRPLLALARAELASYLRRRGLPHRDDPTNLDLRFDRNWIRHRALPYLRRRFGAAVWANLAASSEALARDAEWLRAVFDREVLPALERRAGAASLPLSLIVPLPPAARRRAVLLLWREAAPEGPGPTRRELFEIDRRLASGSPFRFESRRRVRFESRRGRLRAVRSASFGGGVRSSPEGR